LLTKKLALSVKYYPKVEYSKPKFLKDTKTIRNGRGKSFYKLASNNQTFVASCIYNSALNQNND